MPFLTCAHCGQPFRIRPLDPETWNENDYPEPLCISCWKEHRQAENGDDVTAQIAD